MSDTTDLSIIIIIIFLFLLYVYYIRKVINAKYNIHNIKCNPVNLFLKSINADSAESIDNFAECVQLLGPGIHGTTLSPTSSTSSPTPAPAIDAESSANAADDITNFELPNLDILS